MQGRNEQAIADYNEAIRLAPSDAVGNLNRARAYRALGEERKAEEDERMAGGLG